MRQRITLLVLAALFVVVGSFAQGSTKRPLSQQKMEALVKGAVKQDGKQQTAKQQPAKKSLQRQVDMSRLQGKRAAVLSHKKADVKAQKRPGRRAGEIIYDQPEGEKKAYARSGSAYYSSMFGVGSTTFQGAVGTVVFGEGNKVYIKDIISQAGFGTWVEGTISGSTITIQLPQPIGDSGYGYGFLAAKVEYDAEESWYVQSADQTITLNYDAATGEITSPAELQTGDVLIGAIYDDDFSWSGFGDWGITMSAVKDELVEAPAGLETETYSLTAAGYDGSLVNVGFAGDKVYVQGIDKNLPENWVEGTVSGDKVTFKSGQYVGADEVAGYHQYLMSATVSQEYDDWFGEYYDVYSLSDADIEFTFDASTKTMTESTTFLLNAGKEEVYYMYAFNKAVLKPFTEVAATPAAPVVNELYEGGWNYFLSGYGWGYLDFNLLAQDVNGEYILPEKMAYKLWVRVNGEEKPLTLTQADYRYLPEPSMTEFSYGFSDGWDFIGSGSNSMVYYYVVGPEAYGVQAIYRGAGEERVSEIAWAETVGMGAEVQPEAATPAYPDVTIGADENRIGYGYYTGAEVPTSITNNGKAETYDVAIRLSDPAMVGSAIESITFPLQEMEGVSNISVFLTSQLRVENGKNAADLTVKAVTPAEAGFVTVQLDKPYLIPEGGVYVGYSLTIDDASSELNASPINITNKVAEGGFYLHTSDGFLKWLDVAEGFGGSSLIQVTLAGSTIKGNAASVADGDTQYVKTGDAFTVPVTIVNHGAKGIQSVDVLYSVAGQDGSAHVDVAVDAFYGKAATFNLDIPAVAERGNYELVVKVDKVNGVANEDAVNSTTLPVIAMSSVPTKHTLLEEYTGLWCQWCPRGYVGLEKLAELYPEDYVLVSYHNGDDMEITNNYPSNVAGFPDAWMDRQVQLDAYWGEVYGVVEFGIADDMAARNKQFGQADINVKAALSDDAQNVVVDAELTFPYDLTEGNYRVEYILVADGLTNEAWSQSNAYANGANGTPKYMEQFTEATGAVTGLVFNDIAVQSSRLLGDEITVAEATVDQPVKLSQYQFALADAVNTSGMPVIQDVNKLKVAVLLIDGQTGVVLNANKAKVSSSATGIATVRGDETAKGSTVWYDLAGRRVAQPTKGLYIQNGKKVVF